MSNSQNFSKTESGEYIETINSIRTSMNYTYYNGPVKNNLSNMRKLSKLR